MSHKILLPLLLLSTQYAVAQDNYKDWSNRNEIHMSVQKAQGYHSESMIQALYAQVNIGVDSVLKISNILEFDGQKYSVLHARVLHRIPLIYFDSEGNVSEMLNSDTETKAVAVLEEERNLAEEAFLVEAVEATIEESAEMAMEDIYENDKSNSDWNDLKDILSRKYGEENLNFTHKAVMIRNSIKMYCVYKTGLEKMQDQWVLIPDLEHEENIFLTNKMKAKVQKVYDQQIPKTVYEALRNETVFFGTSVFVNDLSQLKTTDLNEALNLYLNSVKEKNGELEFEWTNDQIVDYAVRTGQYESGFSEKEIKQQGILIQLLQIDNVGSLSKVIEHEGKQYAAVMLNGHLVLDFSKWRNEGGMGMAVWAMQMQLAAKYGEDRVILDGENWTLKVNDIDQQVYAIFDPEVSGWRFTIIPYIPKEGMSISDEITEDEDREVEESQALESTEITKKYLKEISDRVDFIIPKRVLLKLN